MSASRILIVDPTSPKGHVVYNYGIVEAVLAGNNDACIFLSEYLASKLCKKGIDNKRIINYSNILTFDYIQKKIKNKILYHFLFRFCSIYIVIKTFFLSKKYDYVFFSSIDIFSFLVFSYLFNEKTIVVDHNIGHIETSKWYRFFWKITNPKINLIVMEPYIKEMAEKYLKRKIHVLKHPLPIIPKYPNTIQNNKFIHVFAPGYCNDNKIVETIIKYDWPANIRITIRGKNQKEIGNVRVYCNFITDDEYYSLFTSADFILIPYGNDYNYKSSAVLHEAFVLNKNVFVFSNNTLKKYASVYPRKVVAIDSLSQMIDIINKKGLFFSDETFNLNDNLAIELSKQLNKIIDSCQQ